METLRQFHLGDILSITTGRLVSLRHMDGVYDILDYMTGDSLYTHQLPRAGDECKPYLLEQYPFLNEITGEEVTPQNYKEWLETQVQKYGEQHKVRPIHFEDHEIIDPVDELQRMGVGEEKIIVVNAHNFSERLEDQYHPDAIKIANAVKDGVLNEFFLYSMAKSIPDTILEQIGITENYSFGAMSVIIGQARMIFESQK